MNHLSFNEIVENGFILGFRKIDGIDILKFNNKYNLDLLNLPIVRELLKNKDLIKNDNYIKIPSNKIYIENEILFKFLDIDYEKFKIVKN